MTMQNENKLVNPYNYIIICLAILIILIAITPIWQFFTGEQVENLGVFPYIFFFFLLLFSGCPKDFTKIFQMTTKSL
jgi:hypothetical protein